MARSALLIINFFLITRVIAQMPSDFCFRDSVPESCISLKETPAKFLGRWQSNKDTLRSFIVTKDLIYSQYKHVMIISEKEFNKSGYKLKDGYVYGFSKTDSLPAVVQNDTIIFCYISDHEIINFIKETGDEFVTEIKGGLILSKKADSVYSYTFISVDKNELVLSVVDHDLKIEEIIKKFKPESVEDTEGNIIRYIADIDKKAMEKFITAGYFNEIQRCSRISDK